MGETRVAYHNSLRDLARQVVTLGSAVWDNIGRASDALLNYDIGLVDDVIDTDDRIDEFSRELEASAVRVLAREAPVATELAYVVSLLRLAYELERCGDLMVNVARAAHRLGEPISPPSVLVATRQLAVAARGIFQTALEAYANADPIDLAEADDVVDAAHTLLLKELADPEVSHRTIIGLTIAGRCFERVGDHAVNFAARSQLMADVRLDAIAGPVRTGGDI